MSALIAIEGVDGSGKGTQSELLDRRAEAHGLGCTLFSFPQYGANPFAEGIAAYLNGRFGAVDAVPAHLAALLYAGDRLATRDQLLDAQDSCDLVVCDRYVPSNLAHQAAKLPASERAEFIEWLTAIEYGVHQMPIPTLTVLLEMPLATASRLVRRKHQRDYTTLVEDIHERDANFLAASKQVFEELAEQDEGGPWLRVPCATPDSEPRPARDVADDIWTAVKPLLLPALTSISRAASHAHGL